MTWNHRLMRRKYTHPVTQETETTLAIHEVYYRDDTVDDTCISSEDVGYTEEPVAVMGETIDEVRQTLRLMLDALDKPIIDYEDVSRP